MPCCMIATPDRLNFGSMSDEGVVEIWEGPAYQQFRTQLGSDQPPAIGDFRPTGSYFRPEPASNLRRPEAGQRRLATGGRRIV